MTKVSARKARERFAELLESVQAGASFAITKHGKTVAELRPPTEEVAVPLPDMTEFHRKLGILENLCLR